METLRRRRRGNAAAAPSMGSGGVNRTARYADQGENLFAIGGVNGAASIGASAATILLGRDEDPFDAMVSSIKNPSTLESFARNVSMAPNNFSEFDYAANFGCNHCDEKFVTHHTDKKT